MGDDLAVGGTVESGGVATAETWFDCVHCQGLIGPGERYRYWTCLEPGQQPLRVYSHRLCSKLRLGVAPLGDGIGPNGDEELADLLIQSGLSDCPLHATSGWSITTPVELFDHLVDLGSINWSAGGICIPDAERGQGMTGSNVADDFVATVSNEAKAAIAKGRVGTARRRAADALTPQMMWAFDATVGRDQPIAGVLATPSGDAYVVLRPDGLKIGRAHV